MERPLGLAGFAGETAGGHLLVIAFGTAGFFAGYVGSAAVFLDGFATFAPDADRLPGLVAAAAGSVACWGCFGAAFTRGRGGPVLDVTVYPLAVVAVCPVAVRWAAHGVDAPAGLGVVLFPVDALLAGAALVLPGASFAASMLAFWGAGLGDEGVREWQRAHLREDFAEAFLEERER